VINILQAIGLSRDGAGMVSNALLMFFAPIATIYYYFIYNNLKSIKQEINTEKIKDKKSLFIGLAVFAVLAVAIISALIIANPYHLK
jgi:Ca2+/Na+ antiporter